MPRPTPRLKGGSIQKRKTCLANLVVEHLAASGLDGEARVVGNVENNSEHADRKHTDRVLVSSPKLGLIHVMAISSTDPNGTIPFQREAADKKWLDGKAYVAFGWNDRSNSTLIYFVEAETARQTFPTDKNSVRSLASGQLTAKLSPE